jgi:adenine-specific DNA methylase
MYCEHRGNPFKGLHRWYSCKPLLFSRASVLGSLLPDTVTTEEFEYLLGLNRQVDAYRFCNRSPLGAQSTARGASALRFSASQH